MTIFIQRSVIALQAKHIIILAIAKQYAEGIITRRKIRRTYAAKPAEINTVSWLVRGTTEIK
jgi:hypothetical protein